MLTRKRKSKKVYSPFSINNARELTVITEEKGEELNNSFASVSNGNLSPYSSCVDGQQDGDWGRKVPPTVNKDQVHDHLRNLNVLQSTGPNEIRSRILKELADAVTKTLFIIFEKSW